MCSISAWHVRWPMLDMVRPQWRPSRFCWTYFLTFSDSFAFFCSLSGEDSSQDAPQAARFHGAAFTAFFSSIGQAARVAPGGTARRPGAAWVAPATAAAVCAAAAQRLAARSLHSGLSCFAPEGEAEDHQTSKCGCWCSPEGFEPSSPFA